MPSIPASMNKQGPLYLGFDLSTQQLKALAVTSSLQVVHAAKFDFDTDSHGFGVKNGVITNEAEHEVYAPVAMWLQAVDVLLQRLEKAGLDFSRVKGISGAGQQHGSVYWSQEGNKMLGELDAAKSLELQLEHAFSFPFSPNWQDASTQEECDAFDKELGNAAQLALNTGSKAHHRFTGPQILRFEKKHPETYKKTSRISLVSSFLASIFLGKIAPIDISDVCGMNLWDIQAGTWNETLMSLASSGNSADLRTKLGEVSRDGGESLGTISPYFVERYKFSPDCSIVPFTGDNPATILALPLRPMDAMVSLGTSTTFLMSTRTYAPDPAVHFFNHPTTPGLYMFMLCYKNGGLAREQIRNALNPSGSNAWTTFDTTASSSPPLGQHHNTDPMKLGLFFPRPEIVPNVRAGQWHFTYKASTQDLHQTSEGWNHPQDDARAIIESQLLSLRLRSTPLLTRIHPDLPPQPRRIYLVGGGSQNATIAKIAGEVLGSIEGVFRLDVGENACALGAAYKAVWAVERQTDERFEELIGARWREGEFVERIADGYAEGLFERYGEAVEGLRRVEERVLGEEKGGREW